MYGVSVIVKGKRSSYLSYNSKKEGALENYNSQQNEQISNEHGGHGKKKRTETKKLKQEFFSVAYCAVMSFLFQMT